MDSPETQRYDQPADTFSSAAEMAALGDASEHERNNEQAEKLVTPEVAVEQRQVGAVTVTGAMGTHTAENGPAFGHALADCQVIAIEGVGGSDELRNLNQVAMNRLLSSELYETQPEKVEATFAALQKDGQVAADILYPFRGSNKMVVFLDMGSDHPDYAKVEAEQVGRRRYVESFMNLETVEASRTALRDSLQAEATSHDSREAVMSQQLANLIAQAAEQDPPATIGVAVGSLHSQVVTSLGEAIDPAVSEQAQADIHANYSLFDQAVMAIKAGDDSAADKLENRILLSSYAFKAFGQTDETYRLQQADDFTQDFDDTEVDRMVAEVEKRLAYQMFSLERRNQDVSSHLASVQGIGLHRQRLRQHRQYYQTQRFK